MLKNLQVAVKESKIHRKSADGVSDYGLSTTDFTEALRPLTNSAIW